MENILEIDKTELKEFELLSIQKFIILSVLSLGLYEVWWIYKSWRFFRDKDNLDIMPAARAIFAIFFLNSLFEKIQDFSKSKGYTKTFSSIGYFIGFIGLNFASKLPDPYWLISFLSMFFLIPALESLNYGIKNSGEYKVIENGKYNYRQISIIIIGSIIWILVLIGMFVPIQ
ncbi:hypothetical protein [Aquimarina algiphila]|uniref:hypothetical protein n=1 Tax=Aquimarina algiphila TaxID=2047982 RepID=UPI00232E883F|nr:hypothetical protein [Aquimarina algiphila]